jgi:hypothetical protein
MSSPLTRCRRGNLGDDVEADPLRPAALMAVGADGQLEHEIAHQNAVELRRALRLGPARLVFVRRDEPADGRGGLPVERRAAVMAMAQGAAEAQDMGPERQQTGHVRRLEPAGEPAHQAPAPAQLDETGKRRRVGVIEQPPARLVGNVEDGAGKSGLGQGVDGGKVGAAVGQQHGDEP